MTESNKLTNILLAIIAVCLVVIALKPAGVLPTASAQLTPATSDLDRLTAITTTSKASQQQTAAIQAVATAIDGLAESTQDVAKSIDGLSRSVTEFGGRVAEGAAAGAAVVPMP